MDFWYLKPCYSYPGVIVYEYELKIGWGKSVSLPSQALPAPPPGHMAIRSKEVCLFFREQCPVIYILIWQMSGRGVCLLIINMW